MKVNLYNFCRFLENEKAIIMGNGPSLADLDFSLLLKSDIPSFATNRVSLIYKKTEWRPRFYACFAQLPIHNKEWQKSVALATDNQETTCFVPESFSSFLMRKNNTIFIKNVFEHHRHSEVPSDLFEIPPENRFLKSYSATVPLIQLCLYMGVKKIALVGQDGYAEDKENNHFSEEYGFDPGCFRKTNARLNNIHNVLSAHAKKNDIQIYNLSQISILSHYPKITLKNFIEE